MPMIDLHTHSTASDGTYTPWALVNVAKRIGLEAIAITDHDTVSGINEALNAGIRYDMEVVPGVEISVGDTDNMHILGYFIDHKNKCLIDGLKKLKYNRENRNREMIERLKSMGFDLTYDEVKKLTGATNMGRPHIAQAMTIKGFAKDTKSVFKNYISEGGIAYVPRKRMSEDEGISMILAAGGLPFLAHINYFKMHEDELAKIIKRLIGYGLRGLECYYSGYSESMEKTALMLADKFNLLKSGGTDFHGTRRRGILLGTGNGNLQIPYSILEKMKMAKLN